MNMISAIPNVPTAKAPLQFYSSETAPLGTRKGQIVGKRLIIAPKGTSSGLLALINDWAQVTIASHDKEEDEDIDRLADEASAVLEKIAAFPSLSLADIAAKAAVSSYQFNGAGCVGLPGIQNGELLIREDHVRSLSAESILLSLHADAARLADDEDPLVALLAERNRWFDQLNNDGRFVDDADAYTQEYARFAAFERKFQSTPASTAEGVLAKAIFALQVVAEGNVLEEDEAADVIAEAIAIAGMGRLHSDQDQVSQTERVEADTGFAAAFDTIRSSILRIRAAEEQGFEPTNEVYRESDAADEYILRTPAPSLRDVALKLRRAMSFLIKDRWAEDIALCLGDQEKSEHALGQSDMSERMLWGAIRDLEALICFTPTSSPNKTWHDLRMEYEEKLKAEMDYDALHIDPAFHGLTGTARKAAGNDIPQDVWQESERLQNLRCAAEDALMSCPSPDVAALAYKYVIAHDKERDIDAWDDILLAEAKQFSGYPTTARSSAAD